ncbi:MAG: hypothetical protein AAGB34_06225 [Planctomycetota bacterium]
MDEAETKTEATGPEEEKLVPVSEAIRYRKRAQEAERSAEELGGRVEELEASLGTTRDELDSMERRHAVDLALMREGAIDLETARLMTELTMESMKEGDATAAVSALRRDKPFLFRKRVGEAGGAMSAKVSQERMQAAEAGEQAARSGDRESLLRYLRARRT